MHCRSSLLTLVLSLVASALSTVSNPGKAEGCAGAGPLDHCDRYYVDVVGDQNQIPFDQGFLLSNKECADWGQRRLAVYDPLQSEVAGTTTYPLEGYLAWSPAAPLKPNTAYTIGVKWRGSEQVATGFTTGTTAAGPLVGPTKVEVRATEGQLLATAFCSSSQDCMLGAAKATVRVTTTALVVLDVVSGDSDASASVLERRVFDSSDDRLLYFDVAKTGPITFEAPAGSSRLCVTYEVVRLTDQAKVRSPSQCVDIPTVTRVETPQCDALDYLFSKGRECWSDAMSTDDLAQMHKNCLLKSADAGAEASPTNHDGPREIGMVEAFESDEGGCSLRGRGPAGAWGAFFGVAAALICLRRKRGSASR